MLRADLQALSRIRIAEARVLIERRHACGADELTGLAVECAIKACIVRNIRKHEFPDRTASASARLRMSIIGASGKIAALDDDLLPDAADPYCAERHRRSQLSRRDVQISDGPGQCHPCS